MFNISSLQYSLDPSEKILSLNSSERGLVGVNDSHLGNDSDTDYDEYEYDEESISQIMRQLHIAIIPIISLIGICGNAMAILLVRTNATLRKLPSNSYLAMLALSSITFLSILFWEWLEAVVGWKHQHEIAAICKLTNFLGHSCDFLTAWLVAAVSVERMIILYRFKWRQWICTLEGSRRIVGGIAVVSVFFNLWLLFVASPRNMDGEMYCDIKANFEDTYQAFLLIETLLSMIIPAAIIIVTNVVVINKLRYYRTFLPLVPSVRFRSGSKDPAVILESEPLGRTETMATTPTSAFSFPADRSGRRRSIRPSDLRLTKTLLLITSLFIGLNLPGYVYRCLQQVVWDNDVGGNLRAIRFVCFLLSYLHHGCLFYVYIFHSPQMKKQLVPMAWKLLECYCLKPVPDFGYELNTY